MSTQYSPIITNQQYRQKIVLRGLEHKDEQFAINDTAVVRVRIKSYDGATNYTPWITLVKDSNRDDDWSLSTLDVVIDAQNTALVEGTDAQLDINVVGLYVSRGTVSTDAYDETWTAMLPVTRGLA